MFCRFLKLQGEHLNLILAPPVDVGIVHFLHFIYEADVSLLSEAVWLTHMLQSYDYPKFATGIKVDEHSYDKDYEG